MDPPIDNLIPQTAQNHEGSNRSAQKGAADPPIDNPIPQTALNHEGSNRSAQQGAADPPIDNPIPQAEGREASDDHDESDDDFVPRGFLSNTQAVLKADAERQRGGVLQDG